MRYGELFAGIGGMSLGLERVGMTPAWFSEIDPYASRVLAKHWPDVPNLGDVTRIDWATVPPVDLLCGGFPCQPFSVAGKQLGEADERNLWPEVVRAIRGVRPRLVLMENVPALLAGGYFGRVLGDLAACGYDTEWDCIPAAAVGAPHRRDRIFLVAHARSEQHKSTGTPLGGERPEELFGREPESGNVAHAQNMQRNGRDDHPRIFVGSEPVSELGDDGGSADVADATSSGRNERPHGDNPNARKVSFALGGSGCIHASLGDEWAVEPDVGRVAYGVPSRVDRLRCLGNAVVPQVAEWIGRRIMEVYA